MKFFCLNQAPYKKNDDTWSLTSPNGIVESTNRNDEVMIFVAIVNGKVPVIHAFLDENGKRKVVNGDCYLNFLQENIWPTFRVCATRPGLWWMQNGAPAHCTTAVKKFLLNNLEAESSAEEHRLRDQRILQIWILWIFIIGP